MTSQVLARRDQLIAEQVTCAVMEATGDYWEPFYYQLEDAGFKVMLVNARHVKNLRQDRCLRCALAGPARCSRAGAELIRAIQADPAIAGPDSGTYGDHPGAGP